MTQSTFICRLKFKKIIFPGLKKVTSEMQTHKNTALRSGPAPFKAPVPLPSSGNKAPAPVANKPPVFTRDGKKWLIVSETRKTLCFSF